MVLTPHVIGSREFDTAPITIGDPFYSKEIWYVLDKTSVVPGTYQCVVWKARKYYKDAEGKRRGYYSVFRCGIYLNGLQSRANINEVIATIGIDSGYAGFFSNYHYNDPRTANYYTRIDEKDDEDARVINGGFFASPRCNDGSYPVTAYRDKNNNIVALEIDFF